MLALSVDPFPEVADMADKVKTNIIVKVLVMNMKLTLSPPVIIQLHRSIKSICSDCEGVQELLKYLYKCLEAIY